MDTHLSLNTNYTSMTLDCHFGGRPFIEVWIDDADNLCSDNAYNGDHAGIDLSIEQARELHSYLTEMLRQAGESC